MGDEKRSDTGHTADEAKKEAEIEVVQEVVEEGEGGDYVSLGATAGPRLLNFAED